MVLILIVSLLCYIGFGFSHIQNYQPYVQPASIFPNGFGGFFAAAFLLRLSLVGSEFVSEFGGEMKDPGKMIPRVMGLSLLFVTLLYVGIAFVATGVLPIGEVKGKNLAAVAEVIFSPGVYVAFIAGGVMLSLVTSLNAIFAWCTRGLYMATEDGWLPERLAAQNRFGTPYIFLTLFFIVGITPILTGMTLDYVSILGNTFGAIFGLFPVVALFNLYARNRDAYEKAPFKVPVWAMKLLPVLAVLIYGFGIYKSWDFIGVKGMASFAIYSALMIAYAVWREPVVRAKSGSGLSAQIL
jgi:APA family basic amino acid/polyamine antiporter